MSTRLYARDAVLHALVPRLVGLQHDERKALRQEHPGDLPVVLLTGAHGAGRSAVLDDLDEAYRDRIPTARVDCASTTPGGRFEAVPANTSGTVELLVDLVSGLGGHRQGFGRLAFPRLLSGLIAVTSWHRAHGAEERRARERAEKLFTACGLVAAEDGAPDWPGEVVEQVGGFDPEGSDLDPIATAGVRLFLGGRLASGQRKQAERWHLGQDPEADDAEAALVRLCRRFHRGSDHRHAAERTLVAALFADLTAAYSGIHWRRINHAPRPLALLDDAHTPAGTALLGLLLEHRAESAAEGSDPLVVVAAGLGESRAEHPQATVSSLPEVVKSSGWRRRVAGEPSAGLLILPLQPLSRNDLLVMMDADPREPAPELLPAIHRFSQGRAVGCRVLTEAVAAHPAPGSLTSHELAQLRSDEDEPVTERMLAQLIPDTSLRSQLVLLSIARDSPAARALADRCLTGDHERTAVDDVIGFLRAEQWPASGQMFVADGFLRAALVHEMRRQRAAAGYSYGWEELHRLLEEHHGERGEEAGVLYHALATGDAQRVGARLAETLATSPTPAWLEDVWDIAAAPHPPGPAWVEDCREAARGMRDPELGAEPLQRAACRLLYATWYLADPLTVPDDESCGWLGRELDLLSQQYPPGSSVLRQAAREWPRAAMDLRRPAPPQAP